MEQQMMQTVQKIMVAIDFSSSSDRALHYATDLAERLSARLYLVHISHPPIAGPSQLTTDLPGPVTLDALRTKVAERAPIETHLRPGEAVSGLLSVIQDIKPDLVVLGSHGHGVLHRMLLGSVAERLCRESPVPVLVVPAPGRETQQGSAQK